MLARILKRYLRPSAPLIVGVVVFQLAQANDYAGEDQDAIGYYEACLKHPPVNVHTLMNLGILYEDPAPTFESAVVAQNKAASEGKAADLQKLVAKGQTWMVEKEPHKL